ncbi:MAG: PorP/SprF family type IX secretion system membrane protein [Williamsia sp.]|nr:PorP/SprF family type IX secretion system membrane protein [Williamsia sp.]
MKKIYTTIAIIVSLLSATASFAQDPSFAQFFSSPLNVNPALTANINSDWRIISNIRDQWIGPASPYTTGTVSYDTKVQKKYDGIPENSNYLGIGGMLMYDKTMGGIQKSSYASLNFSYNLKLMEDQYTIVHKLSMGFGATYAHRSIDFSKVDFQEQFTGSGFDTNLPSGETALSNMKPYTSLNAGMVYSATSETCNFDFGVAAYHLNKPKQSFMQDENQFLAVRKVVHANFETILNDKVVLNTNAIYQNQARANYFSVGGSLGYHLDEEEEGTMVNAGMWYWSKNAVIPYIGLSYKDLQFGFSYDVTVSKLAQAAKKPSTFEVSIILRGSRKGSGAIPCPWK